MKIKRIIFVLLAFILASAVLTAEPVDYEGIAARFIKAFREGAPFADIRAYFFSQDDFDPFLTVLKNNMSDSKIGKAVGMLLQQMEDPAKRASFEQKINREMERAQKTWERMLKYPADPGTPLKIRTMRITIKYEPFKHYKVKVSGKYTLQGKLTSFFMRAEFLILNGKVKIVKFRG